MFLQPKKRNEELLIPRQAPDSDPSSSSYSSPVLAPGPIFSEPECLVTQTGEDFEGRNPGENELMGDRMRNMSESSAKEFGFQLLICGFNTAICSTPIDSTQINGKTVSFAFSRTLAAGFD